MTNDHFYMKVKKNVADNFDQSWQIYQSFEDKYHLFADLTAKLAASVGVRPGARILDVGCGNGISAKVLNEKFGCAVFGVDLSANMITAGQATIKAPDVQLVVGDGENLVAVTHGAMFDYALYNMSIFIFPDVPRTLREAFQCLYPGGKIAFSFYPQLLGREKEDLLEKAFTYLGEPLPRFRVITDYLQVCEALEKQCGHIIQHRWEQPLNIAFLQDFFSIPAQSASLFPGYDLQLRQERVRQLFATLKDNQVDGVIVWRMAEGSIS